MTIDPYEVVEMEEKDGWWQSSPYQKTTTAPVAQSWYNKYSWASGYKYVQPDYKKIRKELKDKQHELNGQWIAVKISHYRKSEVERKWYWLLKIKTSKASRVDSVMKFVNNVSWIGISQLDEYDTAIMQMVINEMTKHTINDIEPNRDLTKDATKYQEYKDALKNMRDSVKKRLWIKKWENVWRWWYEPSEKYKLSNSDIEKRKSQMLLKLKPPQSVNLKTENLRKWKRINRKFINNLSYKPLLNPETITPKKKKVLLIVDGSGSIHWNAFEKAWTLSHAIMRTWLFESEWYYTCCDTIFRMKGESNEALTTSGAEWFYYLNERLEDMWCKYNSFDYLFVFTDCAIPYDDMEKLNDLAWWKKSVIFAMNPDNYPENINEARWVIKNAKIVEVGKSSDVVDELEKFIS